MHLRWGPRRRSARLLGPGGGGPDLISALPDDLLLLVLARLPCATAAARTGVLSRRWRGLWTRLRQIVLSDVPFRSLEAALGRFPLPPPAVSLIDIRLPDNQLRGRVHRTDAARATSLLGAAARLEPEEFAFELPWHLLDRSPVVDLPCFRRATSIALTLRSAILRLPAGVEFPALEALSLSCCAADLDDLLSCCPRLRTLRLSRVRFSKPDLQVNSPSLQEIAVEIWHALENSCINIVAPVLRQLTMSFSAWKVSISVLAPMVEKVLWDCYFPEPIAFGRWRIENLMLKKAAAGQGQHPLLRVHAFTSSTILHGEAHTFTQEMEKHMITDFSVLELHLKTKGHVYGALAFHLLGMNRIRCATQRLNVVLWRTTAEEGCTADCSCQPMDWKSQTVSLTALEEVEINGFGGDDHEIDFLKLIFRCAPMLKKMIVKLSDGASSSNGRCTNLYNIFKADSSVELYVYLSSGLMLGSQNCPSA